jgi:hypothetical protein
MTWSESNQRPVATEPRLPLRDRPLKVVQLENDYAVGELKFETSRTHVGRTGTNASKGSEVQR